MPAADPLDRLRTRCLALPEAHEAIAWGEPTFRVRNKLFAMYASHTTHHGAGRHAVWIKSSVINQRLLIDADPARYFLPPYVGPSGWIGVWIDRRPPWKTVADLLESGYRLVAPKRLIAMLDASTIADAARRLSPVDALTRS